MTESRNDEADRIAGGTGGTQEAGNGENEDMMPGTTGGGQVYLPTDGRAADEGEGTPATSAENTTGAVGEMDLTGAPAGTSGAMSGGGTGPGDGGA